MGAKLIKKHEHEELTFIDLEPGQLAVITEGVGRGTEIYVGMIVQLIKIYGVGTHFVVTGIGNEHTWSNISEVKLKVRLLEPGERIVVTDDSE